MPRRPSGSMFLRRDTQYIRWGWPKGAWQNQCGLFFKMFPVTQHQWVDCNWNKESSSHMWCNMLAVSLRTENANAGKEGIVTQGQVWGLSCPKSCLSERPAPDVSKVNVKTARSKVACCKYRYLSQFRHSTLITWMAAFLKRYTRKAAALIRY